MSKKFIIVDLDNCIADDAWRIPKINWQQKDPTLRYNDYHALALGDTMHNKDILVNCSSIGIDIVVFTARPVQFHAPTIEWLQRNGVAPAAILMRNNDDHSKSVDLKRKQLGWLTAHYDYSLEHCVAAYDDRQDVVDMYRECGIKGAQLKIHDLDAYQYARDEKEPPPADEEGFMHFGSLAAAMSFVKFLQVAKEHITGIAQDLAEQTASVPNTAAEILGTMAETFRERNKVYGDNYKRVGAVMTALFPDGVQLRTADEFNRWHLFELQIVKLTRFANSGLTHQDSIHDSSVYGAMVESLLSAESSKIGHKASN